MDLYAISMRDGNAGSGDPGMFYGSLAAAFFFIPFSITSSIFIDFFYRGTCQIPAGAFFSGGPTVTGSGLYWLGHIA
jgi:hypothetical protein